MTQPTIEIIWLTDKMNTMFIDIIKTTNDETFRHKKKFKIYDNET